MFLSFFILDGGQLPFFLSRLFWTSRLRRCLSFLAAFIRALCSRIIFCLDSSGISSIEAAGFGFSGCSAASDAPASAEAWTITGIFLEGDTWAVFLHCSLKAEEGTTLLAAEAVERARARGGDADEEARKETVGDRRSAMGADLGSGLSTPFTLSFLSPSFLPPHPSSPPPIPISLPSHAREVAGAIASCRASGPAPVAVPARGAVLLLVVQRGGGPGVLAADGVPQ